MPATQANVEYWFRLLYECVRGGCVSSVQGVEFSAFLAHLWLWIVGLGYFIAIIALFIIIYTTMRLFELRAREEEYYGTLLVASDEEVGKSPRWLHIKSLTVSTNVNDWRTAIIESDIMLDEMLTRQGYTGESVGEKLKNVEASDFDTLSDAWEAHKVRNKIAHQGSEFELSETLATRTLARYENVFNEFRMI